MAAIQWIQSTEPVVGRGSPTLPDVANRPLRSLITASGLDPDSGTPGMVAIPPAGGRTVGTLVDHLIFNATFNAKDFGALGDGTVHTVAEKFATLAAAQAVYPHVTALTQNLDWAAIQAALNAADNAGGGDVRIPNGTYVLYGLAVGSNTTVKLSRKATLKLDPSLVLTSAYVLLSNKGIYPGTGNNDIHIEGGTLDGSYAGGGAGVPSTHVVLLSLCTSSSVRTKIINGRRNGLTLEFCKYTTVRSGTIIDTCGVDNIYLSGTDHCTVASGVTSRMCAGSGSGACISFSASWFDSLGNGQFIQPQAGGFGLMLANDTEHLTVSGGLIEGVSTINTQLAAEPYYGTVAGSDHFNRPLYNAVVWHAAANIMFNGTLFKGMKGRNASAVNLTRGSDYKFIGCRFVGAWANGLATYGTKRVSVRSCIFENCGDANMGDGTAVPNAGRYAISIDYLDATYNGSDCEIDGIEMVDTKSVPTMWGILMGPSATCPTCIIRNVKARNLAGAPLTLTTNVPVTLGGTLDWGLAYVPDVGDADFTASLTTQSTVIYATALSVNRNYNTPPIATLYPGWRQTVVRRGAGAGTLNVAGVKTIPATTNASATVEFDGTAIQLVAYGAL